MTHVKWLSRGGEGGMQAITEEMIETLIHHFYARIRVDPDLGPIFTSAITDWDPHLAQMVTFWSAVMLKSRRYRGNPVEKHNALSAVRPAHFEIWLGLFRQSADAVCPPEIAAQFVDQAERIAESLKLAKFGVPGVSD
jgi:hemoglobin